MTCVFPMPASVFKCIDALSRQFLWQGSKDEKVSLSQVGGINSEQGNWGLSIKNLKKQNESLMLKWLWKFANEDGML